MPKSPLIDKMSATVDDVSLEEGEVSPPRRLDKLVLDILKTDIFVRIRELIPSVECTLDWMVPVGPVSSRWYSKTFLPEPEVRSISPPTTSEPYRIILFAEIEGTEDSFSCPEGIAAERIGQFLSLLRYLKHQLPTIRIQYGWEVVRPKTTSLESDSPVFSVGESPPLR